MKSIKNERRPGRASLLSSRRRNTASSRSVLLLPALLFLQVLGFAFEAEAVGGVSNSKVNVLSADTVAKGHIEIEPYFSAEFIDDRHSRKRYGGGLRVTPGVLDFLEVGVSVNYLNVEDANLIRAKNDFGDIHAGMKLKFIDEGDGNPFSLAYVAGVIFPVGKGAEWVVEPAGLALTKNFTDRLSLDTDFAVGLVEGGAWSLVTNTGLGYYVTPWLQAVVEGAYAFESVVAGGDVSIINVTGGFTADAAEWLTVIVGVTPDLYVKNEDRMVVLTAAFTFAF